MTIFELDKEQSKQLLSDLNQKTSKKYLKFWKHAIEESKNITKINK